MTDENTTPETTETDKKVREPKKNSIPAAEIKDLTSGIPQYEKASFLVVGEKNGVRIALPRTNGVSRAYFYANNDYSLIPTDPAIKVYSAEQRKEQRKGGIMAEVDFELGLDAARSALEKLVSAVRNAPKVEAKPKKEKKVSAVAVPVADDQREDHGGDMAGHDNDTDDNEAAEATEA